MEGVNNRRQLADLERVYQMNIAENLMMAGVTFGSIEIRFTRKITVEQDVFMDVTVVIEGDVFIAEGVYIEPNVILRNCRIGAGTLIKANSVIDEAEIGEACTIGPFARIRPGTEMMDNSHIGNFVEMKKSRLGNGSKVNHLTYIGDAEIGSQVNVGAGTITCNYDGAINIKTVLEDGVFIGSNSSLVAPLFIKKGATVGAVVQSQKI